MNKYFTIQDIVKLTRRSRFTIFSHVKKLKVGTLISGVYFLTEQHKNQIVAIVEKDKERYDKVSKAKSKPKKAAQDGSEKTERKKNNRSSSASKSKSLSK